MHRCYCHTFCLYHFHKILKSFYATTLTFPELLVKYVSPEDEENQNEILVVVSDYCGRPVTNYTTDEYPDDYQWTIYHSFWFALTLCSTVGKNFYRKCTNVKTILNVTY